MRLSLNSSMQQAYQNINELISASCPHEGCAEAFKREITFSLLKCFDFNDEIKC
jgi:hypothetical protein